MNTGQTCIAGTRIFVQEGVYDKVLAGLTESAKYWESVTDNPFAPNCQMGPLVSKIQLDVSAAIQILVCYAITDRNGSE